MSVSEDGAGGDRVVRRKNVVKTYNLQPPCPFLPLPGEPIIPWQEWKEYWDNYMAMLEDNEMTAEEKKRILLHALGAEGYRIYTKAPQLEQNEMSAEDNVYTVVMKQLDKHYNPRVNIAISRHSFYTRGQKEGETTDDYIAELRKLAVSCNFGVHMTFDEMLRDQIIIHTKNSALQEKLWMHGNPTLDQTLALARKVEHTARCVKTMQKAKAQAGSDKSESQSVSKVNPKKVTFADSKDRAKDVKEKLCFRCGEKGHFARDKKCPGWRSICAKCGLRGHFSKVCKSGLGKERKKVAMVEEEVSSGSDNEVGREGSVKLNVCMVKESEMGRAERCPRAKIKIGGQSLVVMVDSGSPYTIVPETWWMVCKAKDPRLKLHRKDIDPDAYGGGEIIILGYWWTEIEFKGRITAGKVYVARKGDPIIGWTEIKHLGMKIDPNNVPEQVLSVQSVSWMQREFPEVFRKCLGRSKNFVHHIREVEGSTPVVQMVRDVPEHWDTQVREDMKSLLANGVIEQIESSRWVSPLVVALKANGKLRLCIDLTELNKCIWVDRFPLPKIPRLLARIKEARYFTTMDLKSAYHQIPLTRSSRPLTAFITPYGLFQFKRMPFGLASAAGVFQRVMEGVVKGVKGVEVFQDDILVYGCDEVEHNDRLRTVLARLRDNGFTVEIDKCKFNVQKVEYLGHSLSSLGVGPKEKLIKNILDTPRPTDKDGLRAFLGMAEYYSRFIADFSSLTYPLRFLMKKYRRFEWTQECEQAFTCVKGKIANVSCLGHFDLADKIVLTCDASLKGLGAVLSQVNDKGEERVVGFASRALTDSESRYSVVERELLACSWAMRHFKIYLWGGKFVLRTDHKPLVQVLTPAGLKRATPRLLRLMVNMQGFQYAAEYIEGKKNAVADCLSRLPVTEGEQEDILGTEDWLGEGDLVAQLSWMPCDALKKEQWLSEAEKDDWYQSLIEGVIKGWSHKRNLDGAMRSCYDVRHELSVEGGLVIRATKYVPPREFWERLVVQAHEGHFGMSLTKRKLRDTYWWPGMDAMVDSLVGACPLCVNSDKTQKASKLALTPIAVPDGPWQVVGVDILGPYSGLRNLPVYMLVLVDHFSKWPEVLLMNGTTTSEVIRKLDSVFRREGYPGTMLSDNGPQFVSGEMKEFAKCHGITWKFASVFHPETNGLVERMNRVVVECMQLSIGNDIGWRRALDEMLWSYKVTPHVTTGFTPFSLMRGREPVYRLCPSWVACSKKTGGITLDRVKWSLRLAKEKMKSQRDAGKTFRLVELTEGDWVRTRKVGVHRKGDSRYGERMQVKRVMRNSVMLSNGSVWNLSKVVKCKLGTPSLSNGGSCVSSGLSLCDDVAVEDNPYEGAEDSGEVVQNMGMDAASQGLDEESAAGGRPRRVTRIPGHYTDFLLYK